MESEEEMTAESSEEESDKDDESSSSSSSSDEEEDDEFDDDDDDSSKKKKNEKTKTVQGWAYGINKNSLQSWCNFHVSGSSKQKEIPKIFPIRTLTALPTYCPWILYSIKVIPPKVGTPSVPYEIEEILWCKPREIKKKDVKDFLIFQHTSVHSDTETFKKRVSNAFRMTPKVITCKSDIIQTIKDEGIKQMVLEILEPRFRGPIILSLLFYFSYTFLSWMNEQQTCTLLSVVTETPWMLCFWNKFVEVITSVKDTTTKKKIFPNKNLELKYLDAASIEKLIERITYPESRPIYDSYSPGWCIAMLQKGVSDLKRWDSNSFDYDMIRMAMFIYLKYQQEKQYFKNAILDVHMMKIKENETISRIVPAKTGVNTLLTNAVQFLRQQKILIARTDVISLICTDQQQDASQPPPLDRDRFVVMEPSIAMLELEFIELIKQKVQTIKLYTCTDYGKEYIASFQTFIQQGLTPQQMSNVILLSPNKTCARYMKEETGLEFRVLSAFVNHEINGTMSTSSTTLSKKRKMDPEVMGFVIMVDHVHKCGLGDLVSLLQCIPNQSQLFFFGDINDYGPNVRRGTHHMAHELARFCPTETMPSATTITEMEKLRGQLARKDITNLECIRIQNAKTLHDTIKKISDHIFSEETTSSSSTSTKNKSKKKQKKHSSALKTANNELYNRSYVILCSNEADKTTITTLYMEKKNQRTFKASEFLLWDKIHIREDDNEGRIEKAWRVDKHGNKVYSITNNKETMNLFRHHYVFTLYKDSFDYNTSRFFVEHAEVSVLSKYAGPASDHIIFVAGEKTCLHEIEIAAKYARKQMVLLLLPNVSVSNIMNKTRNVLDHHYQSDLFHKLQLVYALPSDS